MKPATHIIYWIIIVVLATTVWWLKSAEQALPQSSSQQLTDAPMVAAEAPTNPMPIVNAPVTSVEPSTVQPEPVSNLERLQQQTGVNHEHSDPGQMYGLLNGQFEQLPDHTDWALLHEQRLYDALLTDEPLRSLQIAGIDCRDESVCRLDILNTGQSVQELSRLISQAVFHKNWDNQRFSVVMQSPAEGEPFAVYVMRSSPTED